MSTCPLCGKEFNNNITYCPDCGTLGVNIYNFNRLKLPTLDKEIYFYLYRNFKKLYAIGYKNVNNIELFQGDPLERNSNWIKQTSALILKDDHPYISVEMMSSFFTPPLIIAGNILIHSLAKSLLVMIKGDSNDRIKYILDKKFPRYLLIVIPEPSNLKKSRKDKQMKEIEQKTKKLDILKYSSLKNFKVCYGKDFKKSLEKLIESK